MKLTRFIGLALVLSLSLLAARPLRAADEKTPQQVTTDSAVFLLRRAMQVSRDGQHNVLLRALRQMGDPALEPFFNELFQSEQQTLKIHGLLGLAECSPERKLPLVKLASIANPAVQAEVVSAAMDSDLLNDVQAKEVYGWPGIDAGVKMIVAAQLIKAKALPSVDPLRESAKAENIGRRAVAWLLLLQLGEAGAMDGLEKVNKSEDTKRDAVREMLLQMALRYEFDRAGPWALKISAEPGISPRLSILALRTALRFDTPGAREAWTQQFGSSNDLSQLAQRTRLALLALQVAPWLDAKFFEPMTRSDDTLIQQIGITGAAVANKEKIGEAAVALVKMNNPVATNWAMGYAKKTAGVEDATAILTTLIDASAGGLNKTRPQRLDDAVVATELLEEKSHEQAVKYLRPILANPQTESDQAQAILMGLVRSTTAKPQEVLEGVPPFTDPTTGNVAILLLAKHGVALSPDQMRDLALVVRGGGVRQDSIRIQAAWVYLKLTNQTKSALAEVLAGQG